MTTDYASRAESDTLIVHNNTEDGAPKHVRKTAETPRGKWRFNISTLSRILITIGEVPYLHSGYTFFYKNHFHKHHQPRISGLNFWEEAVDDIFELITPSTNERG